MGRLDTVFVALWTGAAFTTINAMYAAGQDALAATLGIKRTPLLNLALIPPLVLLSLWPRNILILRQWTEWISYVGIVLALGIPTLLLAAAWLRTVASAEAKRL